ncbi:MAG: hypothetical protein RLZZ622_1595 [Planctomycetota bacterium]
MQNAAATVKLTNRSTSPRSLRRAAMDCLARREHSYFELKQKLQLKFPERDSEEIRLELERLRAENLQSDRRFVDAFVRARKSRGYGFQIIREELRQRFVAEELIAEFLINDDEEWNEVLDQLIHRRVPASSAIQFGSREHLRLVRFLRGRGFSHSAIQHRLARYLAASE